MFDDIESLNYVILIIAFIFSFLIFKRSEINKIIIYAFIIRVVAAVVSYSGIFPLEGSGDDAMFFDRIALKYSDEGIIFIIQNFKHLLPNLYSLLISLIYIVFAPSITLIILINIILGTLTVYYVYKITYYLFPENNRIARTAAWVTAFTPYLIIFSAVMLREAVYILFCCIAVWQLLKYFQLKKYIYLINAFALQVFLFLLHGAMMSGLLALLIIVIIYEALYRKNIFSYSNLIFLGLLLFSSLFLFTSLDLRIYKLEQIHESYDVMGDLLKRTGYAIYGHSGRYRDEVISNNFFELIINFPKIFIPYFFEPYPWRFFSYRLPIQYTNTILYIFIAWSIIRRPKLISRDIRKILILIYSFIILTVFAYGTSTIPQANRHKTIVTPLLIILTAYQFERVRKQIIKFN